MKSSNASPSEKERLTRLAAGEVEAFEQIFNEYYKTLCRFALRYVHVGETAEELVADVLTTLWQKRQELRIASSLQAYLYASVRNTCLNYLKSQYGRQRFQSDPTDFIDSAVSEDPLTLQELEAILQAGTAALPPACRTIFQLSRQADLSYEEIAQQLGISKKTVKAQMGIALKKLRDYVGKRWDRLLTITLSILF